MLDPGDSAHFDSLTPHRISRRRGRGELLFVHTLMQSAAADLCLGGARPAPLTAAAPRAGPAGPSPEGSMSDRQVPTDTETAASRAG